jgi:predicted tellurium resistance membrane protein TerC
MSDLLLAAGTSPVTDSGIGSLWSLQALVALLTLSALEIVLGIDNIVFIAILAGKLPPEHRDYARRLGLGLAMGMRILLLLSIAWVMGLTATLFQLPLLGERGAVSGRDLILLLGGLFLIAKSTWEIHDKLEGGHSSADASNGASVTFKSVIVQIILLDLVFSLDSVITAVGMVKPAEGAAWVGLTIMIAAVVIAVAVMLLASGPISRFVDRHPTMKILALAFLLLIGVMLVAESFDAHIPKGYIYFAMAFSLAVEMMNLRLRKKLVEPVALRRRYPSSRKVTAGS